MSTSPARRLLQSNVFRWGLLVVNIAFAASTTVLFISHVNTDARSWAIWQFVRLWINFLVVAGVAALLAYYTGITRGAARGVFAALYDRLPTKDEEKELRRGMEQRAKEEEAAT